jgi:hypothetical protein
MENKHDCGVFFTSNQTSCENSRDTNPIEKQFDYVRTIHEIIPLDYRYSKCVIFKCKWFDLLI